MPEVLSSWKEISAYLGRGRRTVQRWEKELGLPVRRLGGRQRGTVLAMTRDIDTWLKQRPGQPSPNESRTSGTRPATPSDAEASLAVDGMLWENHQLLDLICAHCNQAFAVFDREMRYIRASRRWITESGLEEVDVTGLCEFDLFPERPDRWKTVTVRCLAGETVRGDEGTLLRQDARRRSYRWALHPWHTRTGEIGGVVLFLERKDEVIRRMAAALRENEERYRALLAAAGQGVVIIDAEAVIRDCNSAATRILNTGADELVGLSLLDPNSGWKAQGPNGAPICVEQYPALVAMRSGKPQAGRVMGLRGPQGQLAWINATCQPMFRPGNTNPYGVLVAFSEFPAPETRRRRARQPGDQPFRDPESKIESSVPGGACSRKSS